MQIRGEAELRSPSPLNGERAEVRGGNTESFSRFELRGRHHPSPSFPLPVEGRGRSASECRFRNRRVCDRGALTLNPKGIPSLSPGLRGTSYPGEVVPEFSQPQRGCVSFRLALRAMPQPLQGCSPLARPPRVARASQPWAGRCNPFRIEARRLDFGFRSLEFVWILYVGIWSLFICWRSFETPLHMT